MSDRKRDPIPRQLTVSGKQRPDGCGASARKAFSLAA